MRSPICTVLPLLLFLPMCAQAQTGGSNCKWPDESHVRLDLRDPAQQRHLSADAQRAEDLAIRYADAHSGLHSGHFESWAAYGQARDACMATLFAQIESAHSVSDAEVRRALLQRPWTWDFLTYFLLAALYVFAASEASRRLWLRFPPRQESIAGIIAVFLASFVTSTAGLFLGEICAGMLETIRIGNAHLSYRGDRIPWTQHHFGIFIAGVILFWAAAAFQWSRARNHRGTARNKDNKELTLANVG